MRRWLNAGYWFVKTAALVVGFALAVVGLMALVGLVTDLLAVRLGVALVVALGTPLLIANFLLPEDAEKVKERSGLVTDVLAIFWLGLGVVLVGLGGGGATHGPLAAEAQRLSDAGFASVGDAVVWMIGTIPEQKGAPQEVDEVVPATADADAGSNDAATETIAIAKIDERDAGANREDDAGVAAEEKPEDETKEEAVTEDNGPKTPAEIFENCAPAVVTLLVDGHQGQGGGTGFFIDEEGTLATNHHVIHGAREIKVKTLDGSILETEVELLTQDASKDLALLKVDLPTGFRVAPCPLGDSDAVKVGEEVVAIGNPLGLDHTLTKGLISQRRLWQGRKMIQTDASINPGNSGGPLITMQGAIIGINTAKLGGFLGENLNIAVPVNELKDMVGRRYPSRCKIGQECDRTTW